ncbi:MAG: hypothetical protein ACOX7D_00450 [Alphaproteobacteria bacterium]|jgi:hypothetical protein
MALFKLNFQKKNILHRLVSIAFCLLVVIFLSTPLYAESNTPNVGDIADYGVWATENNKQLVINNIYSDIDTFYTPIVDNYVPVEARVGKSLIGALKIIGDVLQRSLFNFIQIFLLVLFAFWLMFEAYNLIKSNGDVKKTAMEIVKKTILVLIWIWVLNNDPGKIFMTIFGPIISAGSYASDLILNSIAGAAGTSLPDTCDAIRNFISDDRYTADLICMPTRLSGFFYTCISAGFKWMAAGIGRSALTFIAGAVFVVIFAINIWKFALLALGVIVDLFLAIILLPFTAIKECFGQGTSLQGVAGSIFTAFAGLFKSVSLNDQIQRFIRAIIYFIVLSIMAAIGAALLGGVVSADLSAATPSVQSDSFMSVLIVGCLVAYLVSKSAKIAEDLGGKIDDSFGKKVQNDIKNLWDKTKKQVTDWREIYKEQKKK